MESADVARLLTMIAAYDPYQRREADRAQVAAWTIAINHSAPTMSYAAGQQAIVQFHVEVTDRPMAVGDLLRLGAVAEKEMRIAAAEVERRERHALPAGERPERVNVRDRSEDVAELLETLMAEHRNWSVVGDAKTRASQASANPALAEKHQDARHRRAQQIAKERSAERQRRIAAGLDPIGTGE